MVAIGNGERCAFCEAGVGEMIVPITSGQALKKPKRLPQKLGMKLREKAEEMDSQPEELGVELILKELNEELDPDELVEHYQALSDKYLEEAKGLLSKGDLIQAQPFKKALMENASLKFWGATASAIKMVGAKRGLKLKKHGSLWSLVDTLAKESRDRDILRFFGEANTLHRNFYENEMTETAVETLAEDIEKLIERLRRFS